MSTNINNLTGFPPLVVFAGAGDFAAEATTKKQIKARIGGAGNLAATGGLIIKAAAAFPGTSDIFPTGRLNAETNVFGELLSAGAGDFLPGGFVRRRGVCVFAGAGEMLIEPPAAAENFAVRVLIQVKPPVVLSNKNILSARLMADGLSVPITGYSFNKPENAAGFSVSFDLARFSDRVRVETANEFSFDLYAGGVWFPVFATGRREKTAFSLSFSGGKSGGGLSVSTIPETTRRLRSFPARQTVFYDNLKETISAADFAALANADGTTRTADLIPAANLTLYDLFTRVFVSRCGFSDVQTDILDFSIRRADFDFGNSYLDGINRHIALFKPLIYTTDDGATLWIVKGTPANDGGDGIELNAGQYDNLELEKPGQPPGGVVLTYAETNAFDYSTVRNDAAETTETGTFGAADFVQTTISRTFREFYRRSNPFVPVRSEKISEIRETRAKDAETGLLTLIDRETETFTLDSFQRVSSILIEQIARVPNLETGGDQFILVRRDNTVMSYAADKYAPKRKILKRTARTVSALVAIDAENQYLGKDFRQEFLEAHRAGNLKTGMETEFAPVYAEIETNYQRGREQIETAIETVDFLRGAKTVSRRAARIGDISANAQTGEPVQIFIENADAPGNLPETITAGDVPATVAISQIKNYLKQTAARRGSVRIFGNGAALDVGTRIKLKDQSGADVGAFLITGFNATGANLGTPKQSTRRTLRIIEIL